MRGPTVLTVPTEGKALVNAGGVFFRHVNKKDLHNADQNAIQEGFKNIRSIWLMIKRMAALALQGKTDNHLALAQTVFTITEVIESQIKHYCSRLHRDLLASRVTVQPTEGIRNPSEVAYHS